MYAHRGANVLCCATEAMFSEVAVVCLCPGNSLRWAQHRAVSCPGGAGQLGLLLRDAYLKPLKGKECGGL